VTFSRSFCFLPGPLATELPEQRELATPDGWSRHDSFAVGFGAGGAKVDKMNLSFQASSRFSNDWMFLKMLRDPSKKWRVDMYGQASGEAEWRQLFSKIVALSDNPSDGTVSPGFSAARPLPLVEPVVVPNEPMRVMERVDGSWL